MRKILIPFLLTGMLAAPVSVFAESATISDNLPIDVQMDLLTKELRRMIQVDDNAGIIDLIPRIRALDTNIPDALYFLEANALYKTGNALAARDRLVVYLANTGRDGRYYQQATELMLQVQEQAEVQEREMRELERKRREELARSAEKARILRIRAAQRALAEVGFPSLEESGQLDKPTRVALATFQIENDLVVNGDISDATIDLLAESVPEEEVCDRLAAYQRDNTEWGIGLGAIPSQAIDACNEAVRDYPAVVRFQIQYARALLANNRGQDALKAIMPAAKIGYPAAEVLLGKVYDSGQVTDGEPDEEEALRWYMAAAERDYAEALVLIGRFVDDGKADFRRDYEGAARWYLKAAELGYPPAQYLVGDRYQAGRGFTRDYAKAFEWFSRAANAGYAPAEFKVGEAYERGRGVKRDKQSAVAWYRLAQEHGNAEAAAKVARLGG